MKTNNHKTRCSRSHMQRTLALAIGGALGLLVAALAPLQAQEHKQKQVTDSQITSAVEERFLFDKAVPWTFVDIKTKEGIVTLTGTVDNLLAKERATKVVE